MRQRTGRLRKLNRVIAFALAASIVAIAAVPALAQGTAKTAVLLYEMDTDLTPSGQLIDSSESRNHGNLFGFDNPASSFGEDPAGDSYLTFDGALQSVWANEEIQTIHAFTLEVEFRTTRAGGKLLGFEDKPIGNGALFDRHLYIATDGTLRFGGPSPTLASAVQVTISTMQPVTDGQWHTAVAISRPVTNAVEYELYLDGVLQATSKGTLLSNYPGHWRFGSGNLSRWPDAGSLWFFEGDVRRVAVYDDASSGPPQPTATPALDTTPSLWLDAADRQGADTVMFDLSGNDNFAFLNNFEDPAAAYSLDSENPFTAYLSFDGVDDFVSTETLLDAPSEFSLATWFRTSSSIGKIAGFEDTATDAHGGLYDRHLYIDGEGKLRFGVYNDLLFTVPSIVPVTDGEWHLAVGTVERVGAEYQATLYLDGEPQGATTTNMPFRDYSGYWRMGNGNLVNWTGASPGAFEGDIASLMVFDVALSMQEINELLQGLVSSGSLTEPTAVVEPDFQEENQDSAAKVGISSDIDGDILTLNITLQNVEQFDTSVWVVREDGEEFLVGEVQPSLTWTGEAITSRYRVEVREDIFGGEEARIIASSSVPLIVQPASTAEVVTAIAVTVAVVGTVSAAAASGTWIYQLIWRFLRILINENLRRRTKSLDVHSIPSWISVIVAMVLMALLIAAGKPGALGLKSFPQALIVSTPIVIIYRVATLSGGFGLAYLTGQRPRYLIWAAGTLSFAFTSIVLHTPIGYTGYLERDSGEKARDARFTSAGFSAVLMLAGLFMIIGLLGSMSFGETGVTLALGVLAVTMLPFPMLGGNTIWKWNRYAGVASGVAGMVPYLVFQLGQLGPMGVLVLAGIGLIAFVSILAFDLWIAAERRTALSPATALSGSSEESGDGSFGAAGTQTPQPSVQGVTVTNTNDGGPSSTPAQNRGPSSQLPGWMRIGDKGTVEVLAFWGIPLLILLALALAIWGSAN